jgi:hypothetical protein
MLENPEEPEFEKPAPKKRARRKPLNSAQAPPKPEPKPEPDLVAIPDLEMFDGIKDPGYVRQLHEADFDAFRELYGIKASIQQEPIGSLVKTDREDLRYPAKRTTCLTRKAHK